MTRTSSFMRLVRHFALVGAVIACGSMMGAGGCPGDDMNQPPTQPPPSQLPPGQQPDGSGPGSGNTVPSLTFIWPATNVTIQDGAIVNIRYRGTDAEDNPRVNVFADYIDTTVNPPAPQSLVVAQGRQLARGTTEDSVSWNTAGLPTAVYTIRATISDQVNNPVEVVAPGRVTIVPRPPTVPPAEGPPVPPPNVSPDLRLIQPLGTNLQVDAGTLLRIIWETVDWHDFVLVNVRAVKSDPNNPITLALVIDRREPTDPNDPLGVIRDQFDWDTTGLEGTWTVTITATEDRPPPKNPDPAPVSFNINIIPAGTGGQNSAPTLDVVVPTTDVGLSHLDRLQLSYFIDDPNRVLDPATGALVNSDQITLTYYLDRDQDPSNDAIDPPILVGSDTVPAGSIGQIFANPNPPPDFIQNGPPLFVPNAILGLFPVIEIDLTVIPVRLDTDEGGRPLPYYIRITADDGRGGVTNDYAPGALRILAPAQDVVDLIATGGTQAGARFQGFHGEPFDITRGARAGNAFANVGDFDGDGIQDFVVTAERATPFNRVGVGIAYLIYGRSRITPDFLFNLGQPGRFSGINDLNSVGTFQNLGAGNPLNDTFFKIRGSQLFHPAVGPAGSLGLTSVTGWNDVTGDGLPEIVFGSPFTHAPVDRVDLDPCDSCTFPDPPVTPWTCFIDAARTPILDVTVGGFQTNVNIQRSTQAMPVWVPAAPDAVPPTYSNVDLELGDTSFLLEIASAAQGGPPYPPGRYGLEICLELEGEAPTPGTHQIQIDIHLEPSMDRGDGTIIHGPCLRKVITVVTDPQDMNAPYDWEYTSACDTAAPDPIRFIPASLQDFPVPLDGVGNPGNSNCDVTGANIPPTAGQPVPVSCYDGFFAVFFRWTSTNAGITLRMNNAPTVSVFGTVATTEEHNLAFTYFDGYPLPRSTTPGCGSETPAPVNVFAMNEMTPACPPANDNRFSTAGGLSGYMCAAPRIGNALAPPLGLLGGAEGPTNDDLMPAGSPPTYSSGLVFGVASDDMFIPEFGNGPPPAGTPNRTAELGGFGNVDTAGGRVGYRIRGAWFQPDPPPTGPIYDPNNRFGQTVAVMPDVNASTPALEELIVSAPGAGRCAVGIADLSNDLAIDYFANQQTAAMTQYNLQGALSLCANGAPVNFDTFSSVIGASLTITGTAEREARMRARVLLETPLGLVEVGRKDFLFWPGDANGNGAYELNEHINATFPFQPPLTPAVNLPFPQGSWPFLISTNSQDGNIWIELSVVADCTVTPSEVDGGPSVTITAAILTVVGLAWDPDNSVSGDEGIGMVIIFNGSNLTTGDPTSNADEEGADTRPQSWPQTRNTACGPPDFARTFTRPAGIGEGGDFILFGRNPGDQFGWAKHAGDLDLDGLPDIACGSPGADTDPANSNNPPLADNGRSFVKYGNPAMASGEMGLCSGGGGVCEFFEIRGSHPGDRFGKVQGNAGDFSGDAADDTYFAAEFYDFTGPVVPGDNMPTLKPGEVSRPDAGFVGVMYGNATLTGEITVRAERIGTGNFLGVKFIGGSAGVRLGQSVANARDFNLDGIGDILMTSPGQTWPAAELAFKGPVADGQQVVVNNIVFEFDTDNPSAVSPGAIPVKLTGGTTALIAEQALLRELRTVPPETIKISALSSQLNFPDPLPDDPTIRFLSRSPEGMTITSTVPSGSLVIRNIVRQGVAYLVFGATDMTNKTYVLPDDLNRRDPNNQNKRVLKGIVFVGGFERDDPFGTVEDEGGILVNFDNPGGPGSIGHPAVAALATFAGGMEGLVPAGFLTPTVPNGYRVGVSQPATITFSQRPQCEIATYFFSDIASGFTAQMVARDPNGNVVGVANSVQAVAFPPLPQPVVIRAPGSIASLTITVSGPPGAVAWLDNFVLRDPTPDQGPILAVEGVGDIDNDGSPDIVLGTPTSDFINILEPCNRRKNTGEVHLIYGNNFGLNLSSAP